MLSERNGMIETVLSFDTQKSVTQINIKPSRSFYVYLIYLKCTSTCAYLIF